MSYTSYLEFEIFGKYVLEYSFVLFKNFTQIKIYLQENSNIQNCTLIFFKTNKIIFGQKMEMNLKDKRRWQQWR
jgi:hypothetical protein